MGIKLYQEHIRTDKCRARAWQVLFWPGNNAEITQI